MKTAKLFQNGRSQAVRMPKQFRFKGEEVFIKPFGNGVLLLPIDNPWSILQEALDEFEPDFKLKREKQDIQIREGLK